MRAYIRNEKLAYTKVYLGDTNARANGGPSQTAAGLRIVNLNFEFLRGSDSS